VCSPPEGCTHPYDERERAGEDTERDADEDADRFAARGVVDDEAQDHADDDAAGEKATEADEVAAAEPGIGASVGTLIDHPPKSHSSAPPDCAKLPQPDRPNSGVVTGVRIVAVVIVGGRSLVAGAGGAWGRL
jgi:hypothetical protein